MEFYFPEDAIQYLQTHVHFCGKVVFLDIDDTLLTQREDSLFLIPYMHRFYKFLVAEQAKIYIITARPYSQYNLQATTQQLRDFGYTHFEALFLMKLATGATVTANLIAQFKSLIRKAVRDTLGLDCVLSVGNEWHDLLLPQYIGLQLSPTKAFLFNAIDEPINYLLKLPAKAA